jgi:hypothetical protein
MNAAYGQQACTLQNAVSGGSVKNFLVTSNLLLFICGLAYAFGFFYVICPLYFHDNV